MKEADQNVCMVMCIMMSQCDFEVDEFDDEYLYPITTEQEFADCQFPFCIHTMKQHKGEDISIQEMIEKTNTD